MTEKDAIITYETLYEILRLEKYRKELQKLDKDFYKKVVKYTEEKKAILESQEKKDSVFASQNVEKTRKQVENIQKILKELYEKRESKIVQLALFCSRTGNRLQDMSVLLEEEQQMYNRIVQELAEFREGIQNKLLRGEKPEITHKSKDIKTERQDQGSNTMVRFLQAVPQFIGEDMQTYGPYEAEDIANLPSKVTGVLIKNKRAESI